ncbi:uncharacterized protein LOC135690654 [Rhopilema esculentum]|uniref:uncharacterized protein LOC135690654 n=1 Tax=Rhopilema esculentum TaxID=499914 RepID=UPI0031D2167C
MISSRLSRLSKLRSPLLHSRPWSGKAFADGFVNKGWQAKVAGAVVGASGILIAAFGLKNAFAKEEKKKRVVVLGSGWGAVSFLKNLKPGLYEVVVVSPTNYFIFTPFLASVTVGTVEARTICEPIRKILCRRHHNNSQFYEAECTDIDVEKKQIVCVKENEDEKSTFTIDYDALIIAVGAETSTFNIKGVKEHTHALKEIFDAQMIRRNIINSFENASYPGRTEEEIKKLLHFVVVGGGPTGVEFAAELSDFVRHDLDKLYPELHDKVSITLIDGYNKLLSTYDEEISHYVESRFNKDRINCVTSTFVTEVEDGNLHIMDAKTKEKSQMPFGMCVWAAGIGPRPITRSFIDKVPGQTNRNAILTDNHLHVDNTEGVYALGDCATIELHRLADEVHHLFHLADKNKDGSLSLDEFEAIIDKAREDFPQVSIHFSKAYDESRARAFAEADVDKDHSLSVKEFQDFLTLIDKELKSLPATAQVAAQQGKYLGKLFTKHPNDIFDKEGIPDGIKPFVYHHLGSFAYIGSNRAVLQMPGFGIFKGLTTMWLWRASYTSECVGMRMKALVLGDWIKSATVGRDTSRI